MTSPLEMAQAILDAVQQGKRPRQREVQALVAALQAQPTKPAPRQRVRERPVVVHSVPPPEKRKAPARLTVAGAAAVIREAMGGFWSKGLTKGVQDAAKRPGFQAWVEQQVSTSHYWRRLTQRSMAEALERYGRGGGWHRLDPEHGDYVKVSAQEAARIAKEVKGHDHQGTPTFHASLVRPP